MPNDPADELPEGKFVVFGTILVLPDDFNCQAEAWSYRASVKFISLPRTGFAATPLFPSRDQTATSTGAEEVFVFLNDSCGCLFLGGV